VANTESNIPEETNQFLGESPLPVSWGTAEQHQQVDVRTRLQFLPAIPANGNKCDRSFPISFRDNRFPGRD